MSGIKLFVLFSTLAYFVLRVSSDCFINANDDTMLIVSTFGSRRILMHKNMGTLELYKGEEIEVHCPTGINLRNSYIDDLHKKVYRSLRFICTEHDDILIETLETYPIEPIIISYPVDVFCTLAGKPILYESHLRNCENFSSFAIEILPESPVAGICYDANRFSLKFVSYLAYNSKYELISPQNELAPRPTLRLGKGIANWRWFLNQMSTTSFSTSYREKRLQHDILNVVDFDYDSLVQDISVRAELGDFQDVLKVIWWRNLKQGNWHFFLDALKERTKHIKYDVHVGVSGEIAMPTTKCNENETFTIEDNEFSATAPKYIWSYVRSVNSDVSEEFVVIAHNSPFINWSQESGAGDPIIFCKDICDEVGWLKSSFFGKVRMLPTMGITFCCRPEEVHQQLSPFPYTEDNMEIKKIIATAEVEANTVPNF